MEILKYESDNLSSAYEVIPIRKTMELEANEYIQERDEIESLLGECIDEINVLDEKIGQYTNKSDKCDCIVAVCSGVVTGLVDALWVGEFDFAGAKAWSNKSINEFVLKMAKKQGYKGERLDGAIQKLEKMFPIPSDNVWKGKNVGISAKSHHLDDLAHHPTILGLVCSIFTQFTGEAFFQNSSGMWITFSVDKGLLGKDVPSKVFAGTINWFFHLVSDMSGSNKTSGLGMGIPGPIVSILKEFAMLPGIKNTNLPKKIADVFQKEKFDLRSEIALGHELGKQALPVLLNEIIVRSFYFIRRLIMELNTGEEELNVRLNRINWKEVLPFNNRTIARMLTIASGTFTAVDVADAAIETAIKGGTTSIPSFIAGMALRVNFVGIGRFAIAIGTDVKMGLKKGRTEKERIAVNNKMLRLYNARIFYKIEDMWYVAEDTEQALLEATNATQQAVQHYFETFHNIEENIKSLNNNFLQIEEFNPGLIGELSESFGLLQNLDEEDFKDFFEDDNQLDEESFNDFLNENDEVDEEDIEGFLNNNNIK